jgi:hypothetical protein
VAFFACGAGTIGNLVIIGHADLRRARAWSRSSGLCRGGAAPPHGHSLRHVGAHRDAVFVLGLENIGFDAIPRFVDERAFPVPLIERLDLLRSVGARARLCSRLSGLPGGAP